MRPRCCFLNLTFFGINMMRNPQMLIPVEAGLQPRRIGDPEGPPPQASSLSPSCRRGSAAARSAFPILLFTANARTQPLALVQPHLHADLAVGGVGFGDPVV